MAQPHGKAPKLFEVWDLRAAFWRCVASGLAQISREIGFCTHIVARKAKELNALHVLTARDYSKGKRKAPR